MTREYHKQRRGDSHPSFRHYPSPGRYGEGPAPRPARPRLNREIVDRAWEQGAQQQHADYRSRSSGPSNSGGRNNQSPANSSYQNGTGGSKSSGYRQRPYGNKRDQGYSEHSKPATQGYQGDLERRHREYEGQAPRGYQNGTGPARNRYEQHNGSGRQDTRRQNRPWLSHNQAANHAPYEKRFEGDYESFDSSNKTYKHPRWPGQPANKSQRSEQNSNNASHSWKRDPHTTTHLPAKRVLKGSQYWSEATEDTELVHRGPHDEKPAYQKDNVKKVKRAETTSAQEDTHIAEKKARAPHSTEKTHGKQANVAQSHPTAMKPSQRGFKWPTP